MVNKYYLSIYCTNMPCQCGYPDQDTHTGMAYLFYHIEQTPIW